jgi:release factor glutamine methyltransferase
MLDDDIQETTIQSLLETTVKRISSVSDTSIIDAQVLLAEFLGKSRTWVLMHSDERVSDLNAEVLEGAVRRIEAGEPLPYVLGHWEFFNRRFEITRDVLIPRPETELMVERALAWLMNNPQRRSVADVGTGSGIIAISLALTFPDLRVVGTDISPAALNVARLNAGKHGVDKRALFIECDLLPPIDQSLPANSRFDLLLANLPYIPTSTLHRLPVYAHEPTLALDGGPDGLGLIRRLLKVAPEWMAPAGMILLEIEASQGGDALALAYDAFEHSEIQLHRDLAGHNRLLEIRL